MCGIVGLVGKEAPDYIKDMNRLLVHRGPDDEGVYYDEANDVALAMRRLSVLDVVHGHQPMSNRDESVWVVHNGEVFNSPELRQRLEVNGARFITDNSDTETLLHLYDQKQESLLEDLNGMFAFVIYDRRRGVLFGARDRLGIKPLYYVQQPSRFAFASELKALLMVPDVQRTINHQSLFHYMSLRFVPGRDSILEGVQRIPPGHWFRYDLHRKQLVVRRYWQVTFSEGEARSEDEWAELIRYELKEAVRRWVLSDVPVGCSLSGGLDSSAIVGLLAESVGPPLRTYSLGFTGIGEESLNELPQARDVAERWGTEHHEVVLEPAQLLRDLVKMVWHLDEPYGGGLPSWYIFQFMSQQVKVGLTGTGGDELFGDYGRYIPLEGFSGLVAGAGARSSPTRKRLESLWTGLAAPLVRALPDSIVDFRTKNKWLNRPWLSDDPFRWFYFNAFYYFPDDLKRNTVFQEAIATNGLAETSGLLEQYYKASDSSDARNASAFMAFATQLPEEFLLMTDRFSMAHALEARTPFLDHQFVELMCRVPSTIRTRAHDPKYLLKKAVGHLMPESVLRAKKRGFVIPTALWLRNALRPLAERLLSPARLKAQGIFRPQFYEAYVRPHCEGRADFHAQVWTALMFQIWHVLYIEQQEKNAPAYLWQDLC
jgi:asparagine synthase (glutamine-hydrolysing)